MMIHVLLSLFLFKGSKYQDGVVCVDLDTRFAPEHDFEAPY